jgi:hypothetical protein
LEDDVVSVAVVGIVFVIVVVVGVVLSNEVRFSDSKMKLTNAFLGG